MNPTTNTIIIDIGVEYAKDLGPRYKRHGDNSGEEFRETYLIPAMENKSTIYIHLDNIEGFSPSFFEEAFGGLVRQYGYKQTVEQIKFIAIENAHFIPYITTWMKEAVNSTST